MCEIQISIVFLDTIKPGLELTPYTVSVFTIGHNLLTFHLSHVFLKHNGFRVAYKSVVSTFEITRLCELLTYMRATEVEMFEFVLRHVGRK